LGRRKFPISLRRKWAYLALPVVAGLVLFLLYGLPNLLEPSLSKSAQQWREFSGDSPPGHPLEVVSHGYRMIKAYRRETPAGSRGGAQIVQILEWEWKVAVKNKTWRDMEIFVNYFLVDRDNLAVDADSILLKKPVPSGETVTFTHQTEMVYEELRRVADGVWEISWGEGNSSRKVRRQGF